MDIKCIQITRVYWYFEDSLKSRFPCKYNDGSGAATLGLTVAWSVRYRTRNLRTGNAHFIIGFGDAALNYNRACSCSASPKPCLWEVPPSSGFAPWRSLHREVKHGSAAAQPQFFLNAKDNCWKSRPNSIHVTSYFWLPCGSLISYRTVFCSQ